MLYPITRMRRYRTSEAMRRLTSDIELLPNDLVLPLFLDENLPEDGLHAREVNSMPGVFVHNISSALMIAENAVQKKIPAVILFGIPRQKDEIGSTGDVEPAIVPKFATLLKKRFGKSLLVIADLCLCEYTSHGHCGILTSHGDVDNDLTLQRLANFAKVYAQAGIDVIAPSGMMDGMVAAIRSALDKNEFQNVSILSYSVKYASAFYGPFRDAAQSAPSFGDRKGYQMPYTRSWEAVREAELDIQEGADFLMVKPALPYLDVIKDLKNHFSYPIFAYQVSGEYAMIQHGDRLQLFDGSAVMLESLFAIKRAGATAIITYAALDIF